MSPEWVNGSYITLQLKKDLPKTRQNTKA